MVYFCNPPASKGFFAVEPIMILMQKTPLSNAFPLRQRSLCIFLQPLYTRKGQLTLKKITRESTDLP
ncbi:MAG: hypothetical protein PHP26_08230, partial [Syntrophomonas sp.]|nr:hypothetical protein [Syntrophomonas sp.]